MNTSRSDDPSVHQTLGERMVMVARMMSVEHVRQIADDAGIDLAEIQRQLREQTVRQDLYEPLAALQQLTTPPRPALPQRAKAMRKPPQHSATMMTSLGREAA